MIIFHGPFIRFVYVIDIFSFEFIQRFPFDWKNPFGYFVAIELLYLISSSALFIVGCVLAIGVGNLLFAIAMSKSLKVTLYSINQKAYDKSDRKCFVEQLIELIEFHSIVKQLSEKKGRPPRGNSL